jgi:hypothetical protein
MGNKKHKKKACLRDDLHIKSTNLLDIKERSQHITPTLYAK